MDRVLQLCKKYNIKPQHVDNVVCYATGIGDILFRMLAINNNLITEPFYINLNYFTIPYYKMDPINQLEFRIQLILDIIKYNNIDYRMIQFVFSNNSLIDQNIPYHLIETFNLKLDNTSEK